MNELLKITKQLERLWKAYYLLREVWTAFEWIPGENEVISNKLVVKIDQFFTEE